MQASGNYVKNTSGNIISPIISSATVFSESGINLESLIGDYSSLMPTSNVDV